MFIFFSHHLKISIVLFFFSSRRRHTISDRDWSSDVCSSDLQLNTSIPGLITFLKPQPVLEISTGATANLQGQFAYAISGIDPNEVYETAGKLTQKMYEFPGFLFVNSDLYNHTPNLQVNILRDQAKLYGVSETRVLNLLHEAYSQNYIYLIKKPTDQYQVILEVADDQRSQPQDLHLLYIKSDDGSRMVPMSALATWT